MTQTFPSLTGDLKQISECWLYRDPRVSRRARLHTFCRECKDTSTITKDDSCPLCRPFFKIPVDGCGSIPRDYFMEKLVDLHQVHLEEKLNLKGERVIDVPWVEQFEMGVAESEFEISVVPAMAWLENKLYITHLGLSNVHVFADGEPYEESEEVIEIEDMMYPWSMTSSASTRSIFISDGQVNCIFRIRMPQKELSRWEIDGVRADLSITPKGELLAGVLGINKDGHCSESCQLNVFDLANASRKVIPLPSEIRRISGVVQTPNENFVISYWNWKGWVSILSNDGQNILKTVESLLYDSDQFLTLDYDQLYSFTLLDDGQILASDFVGARVLLLNPDLTCCRVLANNGHTCDEYTDMLYIQQKQQLFVHGLKRNVSGVKSSFFTIFHLSPCYLATKRKQTSIKQTSPCEK